MKWSFAVTMLFVLCAGPVAAHDPFNDPAYPGIPSDRPCPAGFDCEGFDGRIELAGPPELPDYNAAPYRKIKEIPRFFIEEYAELGDLSVEVYATSDTPVPGVNVIYVMRRLMDASLSYAEWQHISADGKTLTRRTYRYQGATYLPRYRTWILKEVVTRPITIIK